MQYFPASLQNLTDQFARLPGIGGKTAQRLAFHVLELPQEEAQAFADAILEAKRSTAQKHHIKVNYEILLTEKCTIPPADVSSIFFNLLDNGIEGCLCSGNPEPFLTFSAYTDKNYLVIKMRNSKNPNQEFSHTTTKEDFSSHGLGLSIIEEICQRYDGVYEWKDQGEEFVSAVLLRLDMTK